MEFVAETFRLTPLSSQMLVIEREPLVLSGVSVRIAAGREKLLTDVLATGVLMSCDHPEKWRELDVTVTDFTQAGLSAQEAGYLVKAITRTSHVALEAWSLPTPEGLWPYAVVPWFNTETVGASVVAWEDRMEFGGDLFDSWWAGGETWYDTAIGDASAKPFQPLVQVEEGALWSLGTTPTAPPAATGAQERAALRAHDLKWQRERYGPCGEV